MEKNVTISTTVPIGLYQKIKQEGLKFSSLLKKGYQAEKQFPAVLERQNELEEKIGRYRAELERTSQELYRLQQKEALR